MKKFVSVITVLIILLSTCCFTVFAEETESKMIIIEDSGYKFTIYEKSMNTTGLSEYLKTTGSKIRPMTT